MIACVECIETNGWAREVCFGIDHCQVCEGKGPCWSVPVDGHRIKMAPAAGGDAYIAELEAVIRAFGPHLKCTLNHSCCNEACGGNWGTGCHCCHSGRFHPVLRENQ